MSESENTNDQPITPNMLIKWGAILAAVCTTLVSIVWFCASVKQDQALQRDDIDQIKRQVIENKSTSDTQFGAMNIRQNVTDHNVEDMNRKLDVVTTILTRIDNKLKQP